MSRWKIVYKWLVNGLYPQYTLFISRLYPIYQPFTSISWDIQACFGIETMATFHPWRTNRNPIVFAWLPGSVSFVPPTRNGALDKLFACFFPDFFFYVGKYHFMKRIPINLHGIHCESVFGRRAQMPFLGEILTKSQSVH